MNMLCVYALVSPQEGPITSVGLTGERLRRVRVAGIDAIVGTVRRAPRPTMESVRRYDAIVRALAERHAALLPSRFGTCLVDEPELEFVLRSRRSSFGGALRQVRNRVQMTIRIFGITSVSEPGQSRFRPGPGRRKESGTHYLRSRAAEIAAQQAIPGFQPLRDAVKRWVKAERIEATPHGRLVASVYHLIPRAAAAPYQRALERAALEADVTTIVSGPWPPYAFAPGLESR